MAKQSSPLAPREELSVWQAEWLMTYGTASVRESFWLICYRFVPPFGQPTAGYLPSVGSTERDGYFAVASYEAPKVFKLGLAKEEARPSSFVIPFSRWQSASAWLKAPAHHAAEHASASRPRTF
jgi:hypothetical protein